MQHKRVFMTFVQITEDTEIKPPIGWVSIPAELYDMV